VFGWANDIREGAGAKSGRRQSSDTSLFLLFVGLYKLQVDGPTMAKTNRPVDVKAGNPGPVSATAAVDL